MLRSALIGSVRSACRSGVRYRTTSGPDAVGEAKALLRPLEGGTVTVDKNSNTGIASIVIKNEKKRNALSGAMMCSLNEVVRDLESWSSGRGLLLSADATSGVFCSGADLDTARANMNPDGGFAMATLMHDTVTRIANLPLVSVCAVSGRAIGGGAELMLSTDLRVFTASATVTFVQARMGVTTGWGGGKALVDLVGKNHALKLFLSCAKVDAERALQIGLCDKVLSDEVSSALTQAEEYLVSLLGEVPSSVTRATKLNCANAARGFLDREQTLLNERSIFASVWSAEAHANAMKGNIKH